MWSVQLVRITSTDFLRCASPLASLNSFLLAFGPCLCPRSLRIWDDIFHSSKQRKSLIRTLLNLHSQNDSQHAQKSSAMNIISFPLRFRFVSIPCFYSGFYHLPAVTTMKFISRKCLLSSFDPVLAHPRPKHWRTVRKLTQEALIGQG